MDDSEKGFEQIRDSGLPKDELSLGPPASMGSGSGNNEDVLQGEAGTQNDAHSVIVDWNGPDDPEKPSNLLAAHSLYEVLRTTADHQSSSRPRKFVLTFTMSLLNLTFTFGSSVFSAATLQTAQHFHVSNQIMVLATSLYLAVATDLQSVMIFRFLQGFFGSSPAAITGGALADFWDARERGFAMPFFAGTLFAGPIFGPVAGAFITESSLGWRWTQWITLILAGVFGTIAFIVVPETYAPVLLARRAKRLRHETGNWASHAKHEETRVDLKDIGNKYLLRPARMMVLEPILALFTLYLSFVFGQ
ncbi:hypothetical protein LTR37_008568 [Vermiconidia calcicola]|uniref:Uncharacterized protein n=1 Tax=Vermiconidia calcicola TaxID=1690605 RepID=A0ACC3NC18_9PEZI|nr:hypothetical protein LTR37_008568 [Vermiconidia calcicola]